MGATVGARKAAEEGGMKIREDEGGGRRITGEEKRGTNQRAQNGNPTEKKGP